MVYGFNRKGPGFPGPFLISNSIVAGQVKLFCNVDLIWFVRVRWFWGLTCDFAGDFEGIFAGLLWGKGYSAASHPPESNRLNITVLEHENYGYWADQGHVIR